MEQMERVPTRSFFHSYAGEFDVRFELLHADKFSSLLALCVGEKSRNMGTFRYFGYSTSPFLGQCFADVVSLIC